MKSWACFCVSVLVLLFVNHINDVVAQDTSCLNELAACLSYLNGTRHPPDDCCNPLKSVIKSKPKCLCSMISNRGTTKAEQAGINITEAQQLPARCGQHVNPISCLSSKPPLISLVSLSVYPIQLFLFESIRTVIN
ncbi:putative bifunctional inhibitor/plant lipid transfer protein/seed storage helical [Rosa chinensis]|uniref:Putative bifunctional inhibitor/plant lipid transfer protein/seed storage helical n=1 Tax=Rosa chinensis TaxID=74649 RepID=A0A2P6S6R0_ROSCH|nr:putative bifunctional inhibitor/plant lipid transfer protein/seed storage helical [Rosa chinensis]